jgi:hypothetical protein
MSGRIPDPHIHAAATFSFPLSFHNNKKAASGASGIFLDRDGGKNYIERKTDKER